ncbi:MAG: 3-dehydroquinate synthase [Gemmatimonadetes bacterium]|nr:3-dehydroquinate synthase [Gemmatimonadota bacterium]
MEHVEVRLGNRSYNIQIGYGCLQHFGVAYTDLGLSKSVAIVTNPTVSDLYLKPVKQGLERAGCTVSVLTMPDGEEYKTLETAHGLYGGLIDAGVDRSSMIVALGGGVVGDTAGFVAATYLRGIDFVQVPTTLESQVDASVGGKTAVDHPLGKNMVGAFHQPRLVYIDTETLRSLPGREVAAGTAEVIKHGIIRDTELFKFLEDNLESLIGLELPPEDLVWVIAQNCRIKADVVSSDETEKGLREILNYGHTVGHAIEVVTEFKEFKHGEAVCLGMTAAGKIALDKGMWHKEDLDRQTELLRRLGTRIGVENLDPLQILDRMGSDKKVRDGVIRFVLPEAMGKVVTCDTVTRDEMLAGISHTMAVH